MAVILGTALHWTLKRLEGVGNGRAGFGRGMIHGALMPLTLPNLLVGDDVPIYAADNTGRTYKIGYIVGVNCCGLIFFGFLFWRISRLRKDLSRGTS